MAVHQAVEYECGQFGHLPSMAWHLHCFGGVEEMQIQAGKSSGDKQKCK